MGQYWKFLNIDALKSSQFLGKLGESIWGHEEYDYSSDQILYRLLALQSYAGINKRLSQKPTKPYTPDLTQTGKLAPVLLNLPPEIIEKIFNEFGQYADIFYFAATHNVILAAGERYMQRIVKSLADCWAYDRVFCVGDYAGDVPEGCCTEREIARFRKLQKKDPDCDEDDDDGELNLYNIPCMLWGPNRPYLPVIAENYDYERASELYKIRLQEANYLVNHSRKAYVCADKLYDLAKADLGLAAHVRICWSSDPSIALAYEGDLHRGVWAGNRLSISTWPTGDPSKKLDESWDDATEEVAEEIQAIYMSDHGGRRRE